MNPGETQPAPEPAPDKTVVHRPRREADAPPAIPGVRLEGEIARGGMGVVYRGVQEYLSRKVAVKVLATHLHSEDFVARFQREARILSGIAHPNIVGCYQAGVTDTGQCYLVMEFLDGLSLRRHVDAHGPLPPPAVLRMGADLARALAHAQEAGVIHRDVKPENVVLQRVQRAGEAAPVYVPKLVDLGLARADSVADGLTAPGAVMGTYSTMAPEQFDAPDKVDFRADLYGLGCVLFHALTGKPAFPEPSMALVIQRKLAAPAPDPTTVAPAVPAAVGKLVQAMLHADRGQRPASYAAVVADCERLLAGASAPLAATRLDKPVPPPPRPGRVGWAIALLAVVGITVAVGAWAWSRGASTTPPEDGGGAGKDSDAKGGDQGNGSVGGETRQPARTPPVVSLAPPPQVGLGGTLVLEATATDEDTPQLTFRWEQVEGYPVELEGPDTPRAKVTLAEGVPGSDLVFAVTVSDGDHAPVRREARIAVVDDGAVPLLPADPAQKLVLWEQAQGSWMPYDAFVVNGFCKSGLARLRAQLPSGGYSLFGKVELEAEFGTGRLPTGAGLVLSPSDEGSLALWFGPGEGDQVRGELGNLASVDAWPPEALDTEDGVASTQWPRPAVLHFHLHAGAGRLVVLWGAGSTWRRTALKNWPESQCMLDLFVRDGLARFHDLRR